MDQIDKAQHDHQQEINNSLESNFGGENKNSLHSEMNSIVVHSDRKHELFEKLKNSTHSNDLHNFNIKQLQKYSHISSLKYKFMSHELYTQKQIEFLTKYSWNLKKNLSVDFGGNFYLRDGLALSNVLFGIRNFILNDRIQNRFSIIYGSKKSLNYDTNFIFNKNFLVGFSHNHDLNSASTDNSGFNKIHFTKFSESNSCFSLGVGLENNNQDMFLDIYSKYHFSRNSNTESKFMINSNGITTKTKHKQKITNSLWTIIRPKINLNEVYPKFSLKNRIIYAKSSTHYSFGYEYSIDGFTFELGYVNSGVNLRFPILFQSSSDRLESQYLEGISKFFKGLVAIIVLNFAINIGLKAYKYFFVSEFSNTEILKRRAHIEEVLNYEKRIIENLIPQSELNHKDEIAKEKKGLIIHFALYGLKQNLRFILNHSLHLRIGEFKRYIEDITNEVFDVTVACRYMIKKDYKNTYSSVLFSQIPKSKIIGFANPIYKSSKSPYLMISYEINGINNIILKKDNSIFQIPENIL